MKNFLQPKYEEDTPKDLLKAQYTAMTDYDFKNIAKQPTSFIDHYTEHSADMTRARPASVDTQDRGFHSKVKDM